MNDDPNMGERAYDRRAAARVEAFGGVANAVHALIEESTRRHHHAPELHPVQFHVQLAKQLSGALDDLRLSFEKASNIAEATSKSIASYTRWLAIATIALVLATAALVWAELRPHEPIVVRQEIPTPASAPARGR